MYPPRDNPSPPTHLPHPPSQPESGALPELPQAPPDAGADGTAPQPSPTSSGTEGATNTSLTAKLVRELEVFEEFDTLQEVKEWAYRKGLRRAPRDSPPAEIFVSPRMVATPREELVNQVIECNTWEAYVLAQLEELQLAKVQYQNLQAFRGAQLRVEFSKRHRRAVRAEDFCLLDDAYRQYTKQLQVLAQREALLRGRLTVLRRKSHHLALVAHIQRQELALAKM